MPRSYKPTARFQKVDPRFESMVATKFINAIMLDGKKSIAIDIFYSACDMASKKLKEVESKDVFLTALENVKPSVEVRSKRVGGSNYQVPKPRVHHLDYYLVLVVFYIALPVCLLCHCAGC